MRKYFIVLNVILFFTLFNCQRSTPVFQKNILFKNSNWLRFKPVIISFPVKDTISDFCIRIRMNYTDQFTQQTLLTYVVITFPDGEKRYIEIPFTLRNEKNMLIGKQTSYGRQTEKTAFSDIHFSSTGTCTIEIGNLSTKYDNIGISGLDVKIESLSPDKTN